MLKFDALQFDYVPYPIGLATNVFAPEQYASLCRDYPERALFEFKPDLGNKYSLSEVNNPDQYHRFVRGSATWSAFHEYVKGERFIPDVLALLNGHNLDLGIGRYQVSSRKPVNSRTSAFNRIRRTRELSARFEFSMMGADGGYILPHTDAQNKLITLVVAMMPDGEWDTAWGGGTEILRPLDERRTFNRVNRYLKFEEVELIKEWPFKPNQCVVFVKTFNSWHAVSPMKGPANGVLRKTLTINIEEKR
jgi:hypothetical protein